MRFKQPYAVVRRTNTKGSAVFFYRVYDPETGRRLEYSTGKRSKTAALNFVEDLNKAGKLLPDSNQVHTGKRTFAEWAEKWWGPECPYCTSQEARGRKLSRSYKEINALRLRNQILPVFAKLQLGAITSARVESWLLKMNATPRVKNTALQVLRTMMGEAERLEIIPSNPVKRVLPVAQSRKVRELFSPAEITALFDGAATKALWKANPVVHLAALTAAATAMRAGEILGLQVPSLHLEGDMPWVSVESSWDRKELKGTKTGINRRVPIPLSLAERLRNEGSKAGFVFTIDNGKSPLPYFRLRKVLRQALVVIGISESEQKTRGLGFHAFRHWVNTSLRGKVPDDIIRSITGHLTAEMTEHYTSHRIEDLAPAVNVIQAAFEAGSPRVAK